METGNYPPGAQYDSEAPYNQTDVETVRKDFELFISLTKTITLEVPRNSDDCERFQAYQEQFIGPDEIADYLGIELRVAGVAPTEGLKRIIEDSKGFEVTDFDLIEAR